MCHIIFKNTASFILCALPALDLLQVQVLGRLSNTDGFMMQGENVEKLGQSWSYSKSEIKKTETIFYLSSWEMSVLMNAVCTGFALLMSHRESSLINFFTAERLQSIGDV